MSSRVKYTIGIDEVGRGALAGPLTVGAVLIPRGFRMSRKRGMPLRDSKRLSHIQRERWVAHLREQPKIAYVTARVRPKTIDRVNVTHAANVAAARACKKILTYHNIPLHSARVCLDGGLFLDPKTFPELQKMRLRTITRGDEKVNAIKLASIVAKVSRDRYMRRLHNEYPVYRFDAHKGYGTKTHIRAVLVSGPSDVHRLTFLKKYIKV